MDQMHASWEAYEWPEWVPENLKSMIIARYRDRLIESGVERWLSNGERHLAPEIGSVQTCESVIGIFDSDKHSVTGRFVYAWNNQAYLVSDNGMFEYVNFGV